MVQTHYRLHDMLDFHAERARSLLSKAELIHDHDAVQAAVTRVADALNRRFNQPDSPPFPLVLGVMGGAVELHVAPERTIFALVLPIAEREGTAAELEDRFHVESAAR